MKVLIVEIKILIMVHTGSIDTRNDEGDALIICIMTGKHELSHQCCNYGLCSRWWLRSDRQPELLLLRGG